MVFIKRWLFDNRSLNSAFVSPQFFPPNNDASQTVHSCKLTNRHGKSTILMVFTRKDGIFMGELLVSGRVVCSDLFFCWGLLISS